MRPELVFRILIIQLISNLLTQEQDWQPAIETLKFELCQESKKTELSSCFRVSVLIVLASTFVNFEIEDLNHQQLQPSKSTMWLICAQLRKLQKVTSGNICRILYMNCVYNGQLNIDCCWFESWCIDFWLWLIRLLIIVFTWRLITMGTPIWRTKQGFLLLQSQL